MTNKDKEEEDGLRRGRRYQVERSKKKKVKHGSGMFGNCQRNDKHSIGGTSYSGQTRSALIARLVLVVRVPGHAPEHLTGRAPGHLHGHLPGLVPGRVPGGAHDGHGGVLGRLDLPPKKSLSLFNKEKMHQTHVP